MNLPIIEMDRNVARRAFLEYRDSVRALAEKEIDAVDEKRREAVAELMSRDAAIMRGYRHLALGRQVISLRDAITQGGADAQGRPRLAVARADMQTVRMSRSANGALTFGRSQRADHRDARTQRHWSFDAGTMPPDNLGWRTADAIVPMIPPRFRPAVLERYALLWEAEWRNVVPVDPALLRALGDGLYVVLATWDLTPLERAVLGA